MAHALALRYGGDRDFAPFESLDAEGRPKGFQIDLLAEMARAGGFEFSVELQAWPVVEAGLRDGRFDVIAMVDVPARREWALFTRSYATPALAIYRPAAQPPPQSLQSLAGQTVAVSRGEPLRETRAAAFAGIDVRFIELPDALAALQAVASGQAALAVLPRAYGDRIVASGAVPGVVASDYSLRLQPYAFAVAPGNEALRNRLDATLAALEASGRLEALRLKWLSSHRDAAAISRLTTARASEQAWFMLAAAGAAMGLGALAWQLRRRSRRLRMESARRRDAERALAQAQAMFERAFTRHADAMLVAELATGEVLDVNEALCQLLGMAREELLGQRLDALPALVDPANVQALRQMLDRDGALEAVPLRVHRGDGQVRCCLVSCELIAVEDSLHAFSILRDVTEQLQANESLRAGYGELTQRLAAAQAAAAGYTAVVAHDLKAPLRAVRGFVGLLAANLEAGRLDQVRSNAEQIDLAARRMEALVAALARLVQVDNAALELSEVDMRAMAMAEGKMMAASQPTHALNWVVDDALPVARADPALVAQVWQNLLDNAFKFSARTAEAKVRVDSFVENGRCWYRVTDNGAGFAPEHANRLFQPFQRLHSARDFPGTGIGLSLVRRIVERHRGDVRARSQVGVGTSVEFTLEPLPAS